MHWVDIVFLGLLFIAQPIFGAVSYQKYLRRIEAGEQADRVGLYHGTIVLQGFALLVLLLIWEVMDRSLAELGMVLPSLQGLLIGLACIILALGLLVWGWLTGKRLSARNRLAQVEALGVLKHFLPQNDRELRYAYALSITASVVEELVYRGFVFWCLFQVMPDWLALIVASVGFGLAHSYQGISGVLKTGTVGALLGVVYLVTGTIWVPIILHTLIDVLQMATVRELFRQEPQTEVAG